MIASLVSFVAVSNLTFSFFRNKVSNPPQSGTTPSNPFRPFTPPGMHTQPSHLAYASGRPFGMGETPYFTPHYNNVGRGAFNMSPSKGMNDGGNGMRFRQLEYRQDRSRSPTKATRFA